MAREEGQFEMEITDYDRPTRISARWDEPMDGSWDTAFQDEGSQTRMEFETTIEPAGLMGSLAPLLKPKINKSVAREGADRTS